jgi:hypothetical protein
MAAGFAISIRIEIILTLRDLSNVLSLISGAEFGLP